MLKIDHHIHTTRYSPDSDIRPDQLIAAAARVKLDVVVITEHDHQWHQSELDELNSQSEGLLILSGVEVSAREGHFLVYGLPDLTDIYPGILLKDLIAVVKKHGAAVVAAHPFRWDQDFNEIYTKHGPVFDAFEYVSNNLSQSTRKQVDDLARRHPTPFTGSSDAHQAEHVGCYFSWVDAEVRSIADFVAALKAGKVRPGHTEGGPLAAGLMG